MRVEHDDFLFKLMKLLKNDGGEGVPKDPWTL